MFTIKLLLGGRGGGWGGGHQGYFTKNDFKGGGWLKPEIFCRGEAILKVHHLCPTYMHSEHLASYLVCPFTNVEGAL